MHFLSAEPPCFLHGVTVADQPVSPTSTGFDLLAMMARNPGRPLSREQLLDLVYGVAYSGYDRVIDLHIKNRHCRIGLDTRRLRYVLAVYGLG